MEKKIPPFLLENLPSYSFDRDKGALKTSFFEKGIHHVADFIKRGYAQWETASNDHFFQRIDARIKVLFLFFYIIIVSLKKDILSEALIGAFVFILAVISRLNIFNLYKRVLFWGFIFGFLTALPSALNVITRGEIVLPILQLSKPYGYWIYQIPEQIGVTREGILGVIMLTLRVMNSLALSFFVLYTTPFPEIIRALKVLKVPDTVLVIINLSYKYIFIFAKTVEDMHLAKKSRTVAQVSHAEGRRWVARGMAFMFKKTRLRCEEIFKAMLSRGFADMIKIYGFRNPQGRDWSVGMALLLIGIFILSI